MTIFSLYLWSNHQSIRVHFFLTMPATNRKPMNFWLNLLSITFFFTFSVFTFDMQKKSSACETWETSNIKNIGFAILRIWCIFTSDNITFTKPNRYANGNMSIVHCYTYVQPYALFPFNYFCNKRIFPIFILYFTFISINTSYVQQSYGLRDSLKAIRCNDATLIGFSLMFTTFEFIFLLVEHKHRTWMLNTHHSYIQNTWTDQTKSVQRNHLSISHSTNRKWNEYAKWGRIKWEKKTIWKFS